MDATIPEASKLTHIPETTIRTWIKKDFLHTIKQGNARLVDPEHVVYVQEKLQGKHQTSFEVLKSSPTPYTSIGLFTGAGGTALGFENAGIGHLVVNEIDKQAAETLRINRPEWNVIEADIHDLHFDEYAGKVDIVEGGFPCQAFSHSGKRLGFKDARGTLFNEFARVVEETNPKIVMGENVKGLVTHDKGQTLPIMIKMLEDLGYDVAWTVLKSHFLDVGQKRERLIIIGKRHDVDSPILFPQEKPFYTSVGDVLEGVPDSPGLQYEDWKREVFDLVPPGGNWKNLPEDVQKSYMGPSLLTEGGKTGMARRLAWNEPSLTLTCSPTRKQTDRCHPFETRPLTVRESARIQSFPDEWVFAGSPSTQYKQIGNAVPVNLAYHVGRGLVHMLDGVVPSEGFDVVG